VRTRDGWLGEVDALDRAVYAAVAHASTPSLDRAMRILSSSANYSRLSLASAGVLALGGGPTGRRAAASGLAAVAATSAAANLLVKPLGRRRRPDRVRARVPRARHVRMPVTRSFPSGHTAAAAAFATGAGHVMPAASVPLHALAALVGYSRVHTGVHYPGDVVAGWLLGVVVADVTTHAIGRRWPEARPGDASAAASSDRHGQAPVPESTAT